MPGQDTIPADTIPPLPTLEYSKLSITFD